MNHLLDQISNFFTAIFAIYPDLPQDLNQQLKTMQAFLRSYDQKQLFLVQNFVRRLQKKAQKIKYMNKRKKGDLKTEPSILQDDNKQNVYKMINMYKPGYANLINQNENISNELKTKNNIKKQYEMNGEIKRFKMMFNNYSKSIENGNMSLNRSSSVPSQKTPSPSQRQMPILKQGVKINSPPYLQELQQMVENVNFSSNFIEPLFEAIQINRKRNEIKNEYSQMKIIKSRQCINSQNLTQIKDNIKQLRELLQDNQSIDILSGLLEENQDQIQK